MTRMPLLSAVLLLVPLGLSIEASAATHALVTAPAVRPELPVTATMLESERAQNSPTLAVDPTDSRYVALASRVDAPAFDCALQVSGDKGRTWLPAHPVPVLPEGADRCYAPEIAFDNTGTLYYLFIGLHGEGNTPMGAFLTTSKGRGDFTAPRQVLGPDRFMARMVVDRNIGAHGRIHVVWLEPGQPPALGGLSVEQAPILAVHSDDGGATFSRPVVVSDPTRQLVVAPAVALGRDGTLHVAYYDLRDDRRDYRGLEGPAWEGTWSVVVSTSTDRGVTFSRHAEGATDVKTDERVMLIFTMPPPSIVADAKGGVWVAWPDARSGDSDVLAAASSDGARTFSPPVRIDDDPVASASKQYLPRLSLASDGRLDAIFYDRRNDPEDRKNDVYYTYSLDGGRLFAPNLRVTSESSSSLSGAQYGVPSAKGLVEFGSRLALVPTASGLLAAWTDTRNVPAGAEQQDVFATQIVTGDHGSRRSPFAGLAGSGIAAGMLVVAGGVIVAHRRRRHEQG
jgi:hypothetical protein